MVGCVSHQDCETGGGECDEEEEKMGEHHAKELRFAEHDESGVKKATEREKNERSEKRGILRSLDMAFRTALVLTQENNDNER